jgi:hypothetical protein
MDTRMTKRRNFSDNFKAAVALEALRGDKTVQEIAANAVGAGIGLARLSSNTRAASYRQRRSEI